MKESIPPTSVMELDGIRTIETLVIDDARKTDEKIEAIGARIETISQSNPEKAIKLKEKLKERIKKYTAIFSLATYIASMGLLLNHERTRYKVRFIQKGESLEYVHEDAETTEIINYLSGRGELSRVSRFKISKAVFLNWFDGMHFAYPPELKSADEPTFKKIVREVLVREKQQAPFESEDWHLDIFSTAKVDLHSDLYDVFWQIEAKAGNPRVRWGFSDPLYRLIAGSIGGIGFYNPLNNTIYIDPPLSPQSYSLDDFVSEAAHGVQARKPFQFMLKLMKTYALFSQNVIATGDIHGAYLKTYQAPGTLEYDAHRVIERDLLDGVDKAIEASENKQ
ncbi:MAG TPA: hypothetical protein VJJ72_01945 [Candidatus Paceibacterota bacterium]